MMTKMRKTSGFTLIEIMVVVVILGILAMMIIPKVMDRPEQARMVKAKQDILSLEDALALYKLDNGRYPTTDQGLQSLVEKPSSDPVPPAWKPGGYVKRLPKDPWGHDYQYLNPGEHDEVDVFSYGPHADQETSVTDNSEVIGNWNA